MVGGSDAVKGGGGSSTIKVGTTGKISVLMRKELESTRSEPSRKCPTGGPVSVSCSRRNQGNGKSSGGGSLRSFSHGSQGGSHRTKTCNSRPSAHHVPFLSSDEVSSHGTPNRELPGKIGCCVVEIVDLNCGTSERGWSRPMPGRLKKLCFSRLSQTIN